MSGNMKLYHEIVWGADSSAYWAFVEETVHRCDHCDRDHVESRTYLVGEQFCPTPDCSCREVVLTVMYLEDAVATAVGNAFVDLDHMELKKTSWKDLDFKHELDQQALRSVEEKLRNDASYRLTLADHWSKVRVAKRGKAFAELRHRKRRRKALAKRRR